VVRPFRKRLEKRTSKSQGQVPVPQFRLARWALVADNHEREALMFSTKVKISLLVGAHVIGGLLMAWYVNTHHIISPVSTWMSTGRLTLVFTQAGLIGIWGGLSTIRIAWRLTAVVATTAFAWAALFIVNPAGGKHIAIHIMLNTVPILVVLSVVRYSRRRLRLAHLANETPAANGFQFSIRHLLLATAIVAIVLGIGRGVRTFGNTQSGVVAMVIYPFCFSLVALATLWAALGIGRPIPRVAVVVLTAFAVGTIPMYYNGMLGQAGLGWWCMMWSAMFGLQAIISAASLLVVRSCGWRMVSGATNTAMPAPRRFRPQFQLWHLFLVVTLVGVGFGTWHWLTRNVVVVRAATAEDEEWFSDFMEDDEQGDMEGMKSADLNHKRNVAVATGRFMRGTWLLVSLHIVQAGIVEQAFEQRVGRDETGPMWETMNWGLSLNEFDAIGGQTTELTITSEEDAIDYPEEFEDVPHNINVIAKKTLPGTITPGRPHVVYVEGDQAIVVDGKMSVEEFAKTNPGNYLVVTVEVR